MISAWRTWCRAREGVAMVEFAVAMPLLLVMFYGCIEVTRYILITQKCEKLAHTVADVTAQSTSASAASMNQLLTATEEIMEPFGVGGNSRILISSLYREPGAANAEVNWCHDGGGTLVAQSRFGSVGETPVMPGGFTFNERENVIAAEVYYRFSPLITSQFFGTTTIYRTAFYKPRLGSLTNTPAGSSGC